VLMQQHLDRIGSEVAALAERRQASGPAENGSGSK